MDLNYLVLLSVSFLDLRLHSNIRTIRLFQQCMHHVVQNRYLMLEYHRDHINFVPDILGFRKQRCLFSNVQKRIGALTDIRRLAQQVKVSSMALTFEPSCGGYRCMVELLKEFCLFVGLQPHQHRLKTLHNPSIEAKTHNFSNGAFEHVQKLELLVSQLMPIKNTTASTCDERS